MEITKVLSGLAVSDMDAARRWYEVFFGHPADADPMDGLTEWHTAGGTVQLVLDPERAGGSTVTVWVPDAHAALADLKARGGPAGSLDTDTSDKVLFATVTDPDGNAITIVEVRQGADL